MPPAALPESVLSAAPVPPPLAPPPQAPASASAATKRYLPWVVALALFMEQLDATIVNTGIPAMAASLGSTPLALKSVAASYVLALAVCIPASGWLAERYGSRRVFLSAVTLFTLASVACGLALNAPMLVASRIAQGMAAAMMMPVGRMALVRTFPKAELLRAMNFVVVPALLGPLLGPTVGGLIVHWASWRAMFFVNVPVGLLALWVGSRHMPDYRAPDVQRRPLDVTGLLLFGAGTAVLSWLLEVFGEHGLTAAGAVPWLALSVALLAGYGWHSRRVARPLLNLALLRLRTFRVSVLGGFVTRLGVGGMPLLLPLLYQVGMGLPAWQSGLLMMPAAAAAMVMKPLTSRLLSRFGYRRMLMANTLAVAGCMALFTQVGPGTPLAAIVVLGLAMGLFNSLQFSSMNSLAYADVDDRDAADGSTIASTFQQLSMSFGLASGSLVAGLFLQSSGAATLSVHDLHGAFAVLAAFTVASSLMFRTLQPGDGDSMSRPSPPPQGARHADSARADVAHPGV